jgi:hypothetical protein
MRYEKATSRSSEAAVAGWISSNDVTLFTVVLVLVIAMFLQTRLSKGARESIQLGQEKDALAEHLQSTASDLDASRKLLDRTLADLNLTQEQRDQLRQQLVEKLEELAQLNAKLELVLKQKGDLELAQQTLFAAKEALTDETDALRVQQASLVSERKSLTQENASLEDRLAVLSAQLAQKVAALAGVEQERDRLKKQADELDAIVAGLARRLDELNIDLTETRDRATAASSDAEARIRELEAQLAASDEKADDYLAKLKRATELFQGLQTEKQQLQVALSEAEQRRQAELLEEGRNNRELVGLTGRLERVAILFDASGSMRQAGTSAGGDRWAEAQAIAATWLTHLNVKECVLIVFSTSVRTFPEDGALAIVHGESGQVTRDSLLKHLTAITPGGWTNTHEALLKAYEYDIDSILLFTDGAPSKSASGVFDAALAEEIYNLCRAHANIPIHTIGLGNYFDANAATFLQSVANLTNGSFRGL